MNMKVVIIGASGTIGRAVQQLLLQQQHEVIGVRHQGGEWTVDMTDADSIAQLFARVGHFDALVVASGAVAFNSLSAMSTAEWQVGLNSKLLGQIHLTQAALPWLNEGGSITLISGILSSEPIAGGISASVVNGAVEHFVRAAACEMPRRIRINAVSPSVVTESLAQYGAFFPGFEAVDAARVAKAYYKALAGIQNGQIFRVE